ncbi:MAG TPA: aminoglycoside phosphotransferase family protein [Tenuifilaceae bacterium]|nr:aminoglycoside phosphotransferase family protein [Tenuifilaceae bacterium]
MFDEVVHAYFPNSAKYGIEPLGNGHINETYKLTLIGNPLPFVLQKINANVFRNPQTLVNTHLKLQNALSGKKGDFEIPRIIPNQHGEYLTADKMGNPWRLTNFIFNSYTLEVVEHPWQARQAGMAYGWFVGSFSGLEAADFEEPIKDFHSLPFRVNQLHDAIEKCKTDRLKTAKALIAFYGTRGKELGEIGHLVVSGRIPTRVVHNDTKINNVLFRGERAVSVIDLDTVGPGSLLYDFGDAIRTLGCEAPEDERDIDKVRLNINWFLEFTRGYMSRMSKFVSRSEMENLHLAPMLMTYIMGIRFLTDYLAGDKYYRIAYPEHNFVRSSVQMALIKSMEKNRGRMKTIIEESLH